MAGAFIAGGTGGEGKNFSIQKREGGSQPGHLGQQTGGGGRKGVSKEQQAENKVRRAIKIEERQFRDCARRF